MTVRSTPIFVQAGSHPAEETRLMLGGMLSMPPTSFAGGAASSNPAHGVVTSTDLAVTQNGTPNMSVNVAAGGCFIRGTESLNQGAYYLWNDATVNLSISAADATNPRRDLVIAVVRDQSYSGGSSDARIIVVTGTPAASPSDPSLTAYPNALVLARIAVAAADTSIVTAEITDLRTLANQTGKLPVFTTTTIRDKFIPSPYDGQGYYYNTGAATEGPEYWNGSAYRRPWNMPWGLATAPASNTGGALNFTSTTYVDFTSLTLSPLLVANRRYRLYMGAIMENPSAGNTIGLLRFWNDTTSTQLQQANYSLAVSAQTTVSVAGIFTSSTTGSVTFKVQGAVASAGQQFRLLQGATYPAYFAIEDIGPAGAPA